MKFSRTALLLFLALLSVQASTFFVATVSAMAEPAAASPAKKKNKSRKTKKLTILKGRHGKHKRRPA
jgi:hypothetical protein